MELALVYKRKNGFGNTPMELFSKRPFKPHQISQETKWYTPDDAELVGHSITKFYYDTDVKLTFPKWVTRYEDLFTMDLKELADDWKVQLLLIKLGLSEHDWYSNFILSKHLWEYNFAEIVKNFKLIFSEYTSLFLICFNCLNITKCGTVKFMTFAGSINKEYEHFKIFLYHRHTI